MFCFSKPSRDLIERFIASQSEQDFSYDDVGFSRKEAPEGFNVDRTRTHIGCGVDTFERAKLALREWKMFDMPWVELCWPVAPIRPGITVAVLVSHLGFWSLNACRIVYLIDEDGPTQKFGFAYGTLEGHSESGEERFVVEFNREDQTVWYDLLAFSRPRALARLAYPYTRRLQKRFAEASSRAMQGAVES